MFDDPLARIIYSCTHYIVRVRIFKEKKNGNPFDTNSPNRLTEHKIKSLPAIFCLVTQSCILSCLVDVLGGGGDHSDGVMRGSSAQGNSPFFYFSIFIQNYSIPFIILPQGGGWARYGMPTPIFLPNNTI